MVTVIVFWCSVGFVFYAYLGYPLLLWIVSLFRNKTVRKASIIPVTSFIIAVHNEEDRIREKIENTLGQTYPKQKIEIIVASDCSTDRTDEIVRSYSSAGVKFVNVTERKGKEYVQKMAIGSTVGEILVFSDVATLLTPEALANIVKNFNDPSVGCVSSVDVFIDRGSEISGEGAYVRYEMLVRSLESRVNSLVGLSGSFFAARRQVCEHWATDLQSDFNTVLNTVKLGMRGVCDPDCAGYYRNIGNENREFDRKVRTVLRGITVLMKSRSMLNPYRYGLFAWQLFSHKVCRWTVPFAMVLAFVSNIILIPLSLFYFSTGVLQLLFYFIATVSITCNLPVLKSAFRLPSYLLLVNLSMLSAWFCYLRGQRVVAWTPSQR